eukprot:NODE_345_length_9042_cov_0.258973.p3 type:complete len:283 gc:universal NODE_345_length_9042_cov_0.258973:2496-3344(+)
MHSDNPLYSIFPQYSHGELDQIYSEFSYDADAASEQITNGALDWNKKNAQKIKKKPYTKPSYPRNQQKKWVRPRKEEQSPKESVLAEPKKEKIEQVKQPSPIVPQKMEKQDSAIDAPSLSYVLQHGHNEIEMVEADLATLDLSQFVVLIPKSTFSKQREQSSNLNEEAPVSAPFSLSSSEIVQSKPLFNAVPVQDKLRLLGIEDDATKTAPSQGNEDLKDFVLNMGIGINEPSSPHTPPNTPVYGRPKFGKFNGQSSKKPYKKRYYNSPPSSTQSAAVQSNK